MNWRVVIHSRKSMAVTFTRTSSPFFLQLPECRVFRTLCYSRYAQYAPGTHTCCSTPDGSAFKFTACRTSSVVCERPDIKQMSVNALIILPSHHFIKTIRHCEMFQSVKGHLQGEYLIHSSSKFKEVSQQM